MSSALIEQWNPYNGKVITNIPPVYISWSILHPRLLSTWKCSLISQCRVHNDVKGLLSTWDWYNGQHWPLLGVVKCYGWGFPWIWQLQLMDDRLIKRMNSCEGTTRKGNGGWGWVERKMMTVVLWWWGWGWCLLLLFVVVVAEQF